MPNDYPEREYTQVSGNGGLRRYSLNVYSDIQQPAVPSGGYEERNGLVANILVPFNIASYSALLHVVAHLTGKNPLGMMHLFGDTHIYQNHVDAVNVQLSRDPFKYSNPKLRINPDLKDINDVKVSDFILDDYEHFPYIKADVSV